MQLEFHSSGETFGLVDTWHTDQSAPIPRTGEVVLLGAEREKLQYRIVSVRWLSAKMAELIVVRIFV